MVIVGASGHGVVALDAARQQGCYEVVGFLDSFRPAGQVVAGLPILGHPEQLASLIKKHQFRGVFLGISNNWTRKEVHEKMRASGPDFEAVSVVHPLSTVADGVEVGAGSLILAGAIVNVGCRVGQHCIINTKSSLDHDSEMKPYASLLPGVTTGGNVVVGECSCVCIGATLAHRVTVGEHAYVGAGAVVLRDVPPLTLAAGVPAKVIRNRLIGERHF
jgi:sugar O-acyltransferase (sialic acid O-acetyltransferase NeuD family)